MSQFVTGTDTLDPHYKAEVLADSVSPDGVRLTTFRLTYPRFIHSEMMTHRVFSRNAASSRAIPTERLIEQVRTDPFVPAIFNARVAGMGVGEKIENQEIARRAWLAGASRSVTTAKDLLELNLDKSRVNRVLEPFLWYTAIFTGTEWDNFLALRDHEGAQPEIQAVARSVKRAFRESVPVELEYGMWHLPLATEKELGWLCKLRQGQDPTALAAVEHELKLISASRCARVSYDRFDDESVEKTLERAEILMANGHFSPFEHVARPLDETSDIRGINEIFIGNFRGWVQFRKEIANEARFDLLEAAS